MTKTPHVEALAAVLEQQASVLEQHASVLTQLARVMSTLEPAPFVGLGYTPIPRRSPTPGDSYAVPLTTTRPDPAARLAGNLAPINCLSHFPRSQKPVQDLGPAPNLSEF